MSDFNDCDTDDVFHDTIQVMSNFKITGGAGEPTGHASLHSFNMDNVNSNPDEELPSNPSIKVEMATVNPISKVPYKRLKFRTLVTIVLMLQKRFNYIKSMGEMVDVTNDVIYWRALALSRGEDVERYGQIIEMQRQRIENLERDLRTLVNLAQETQKMLVDMTPEQQETI